jgi:hypothetical protein
VGPARQCRLLNRTALRPLPTARRLRVWRWTDPARAVVVADGTQARVVHQALKARLDLTQHLVFNGVAAQASQMCPPGDGPPWHRRTAVGKILRSNVAPPREPLD